MSVNKQIERSLPPVRYSYTLERLIKHNEIFVLVEDEKKYAVSDFEGNTLISFWPSEEIALKNAKNNWEGYQVKKHDIDSMEVILDVIEDNKWIMDIFPIDSKTGTLVTVEEFILDLNKMHKAQI